MPASGWLERAVDWLDDRYDVRFRLLDRLATARLPAGSPWGYRFGVFALLAVALEFATGVFLLLDYVPTTEGAQPSLRRLETEIPYGWFVHALHVVGASLAVSCAALYLLAVVLRGLYRRPRELNWVVLVLAMAAVLAMAYTGSILPWDDRSVAAATVGHGLASRIPLAGPGLADLVFGAQEPGEWTLRRAMAFHLVLGPIALVALVIGYTRLVRLTGHERVEE